MHGRPRQAPSAATPEELAKIAQYNKHKTAALAAYKNRIFSPTTLALTAAILTINPDLNTLFNFRKEQLLDQLINNFYSNQNDFATICKIYKIDLDLSTTALKKNPKSYHAWYHRIWCIEHGLEAIDLDEEFALTEKYLFQDSRNFHCWNYRRYIARIAMGLPSSYDAKNRSQGELDHEAKVVRLLCQQQNKPVLTAIPPITHHNHDGDFVQGYGLTKMTTTIEKELLFTQRMIENDFSNFSAWHYRSILLPTVIMRKIITLSHQSLPKVFSQQSFDHFYGITLNKLEQFDLPRALQSTFIDQSHGYVETNLPNMQNSLSTTQSKAIIDHISSIIAMYVSFDMHYINIALSMSPTDQSPWFYQRWLLSFIQSLVYTKPFEKFQAMHDKRNMAINNNKKNDSVNNRQIIVLDNLFKNDRNIQLLASFPTMSFVPQNDYNLTHYLELLNYTSSDSCGNDLVNNTIFPPAILTTILTQFRSTTGTHTYNPHYIHHNDGTMTNSIAYIISQSSVLNLTTLLDIIHINLLSATSPAQKTPRGESSTLLDELQTLQLSLLSQQYKYYSQDLLSLIIDTDNSPDTPATTITQISTQQYQQSRLTLLSIVILSLSIEYVLNIHKQYQYLNIALYTTSNCDITHNHSDESTQNFKYLDTKRYLVELLKQPIPITTTCLNTIQYLLNTDTNRREYYSELLEFYQQVQIYSQLSLFPNCDGDVENDFVYSAGNGLDDSDIHI